MICVKIYWQQNLQFQILYKHILNDKKTQLQILLVDEILMCFQL